MTTVSTRPATAGVWNLPNQITVARLVLTLAVFLFMGIHYYATALVLFLLAAATDWVDGYVARRYKLVTQVGRMLDPFADKLLISGALIFLVAIPGSRIAPWVAVVVVARELLITAIRSFLEQQGRDFSAKMAGKVKMVFQTALVVASLVLLWQGEAAPRWLPSGVWTLGIVTVISTLQSGTSYLLAAVQMVGQGQDS